MSSDSLHANFTSINICNRHFCSKCDGRQEAINLRGTPGWNFVMCEQVGYYVTISTSVSDLTSDEAKLRICEVVIFGQNGNCLFYLKFDFTDWRVQNVTYRAGAHRTH